MSPSGYVYESLAGFNLGKFDAPTGRVMADTTSIVVLEVYELWRHNGDTSFVRRLWPNVTRAVSWCIGNANGSDGFGLPQYLTNTCACP